MNVKSGKIFITPLFYLSIIIFLGCFSCNSVDKGVKVKREEILKRFDSVDKNLDEFNADSSTSTECLQRSGLGAFSRDSKLKD